MAGDIKRKAGATTTLVGSASSLLLTTGSQTLGPTTLDNQTNLDRNVTVELKATFTASPTIDNPINLFLVPAGDNSTYPDVDTASSPPKIVPACLAATFSIVKNATGAQTLTNTVYGLEPKAYRAYVVNSSGQSLSAGWSLISYGSLDQYT